MSWAGLVLHARGCSGVCTTPHPAGPGLCFQGARGLPLGASTLAHPVGPEALPPPLCPREQLVQLVEPFQGETPWAQVTTVFRAEAGQRTGRGLQ